MLMAKPCEVTAREICTPMAAIFFSSPDNLGLVHTPVRPAIRVVWTAYSAQKRISAFFQQANEFHSAQPWRITPEIEDRISDKLPGAVIGDVAAAIDFVERNAAAREQFVGGDHVGTMGIAPQREHRRMLQQQEGVPDSLLVAEFYELLLQRETAIVFHSAEIEITEHMRLLHCE